MTTRIFAPQPERATSGALTLACGSSTDKGSRSQNEDSLTWYATASGVVAIVADGMGGGVDGKLFSERAVAFVRAGLSGDTGDPSAVQLERAVQDTAGAINALRETKPVYRSSGTTLLVAQVRLGSADAEATVANVGDSRAYLIRRSGQAEALTRDHTYGEQLLDEGRSPEEAARDPQALRLTYVLGNQLDLRQVPKFLTTVRLQPGDRLLLCTDGVSKFLGLDELGALIAKHPAQQAADAVIKQALAHGSRDNVSALVIHCQPAPPRRALLVPVLLAALLVALISVGALLARGVFGANAAPPAGGGALGPRATITPLVATTTPLPTTTTLPGTPTSTPAPSVTPTSTPTPTPTSTPTPTVKPPPTAKPSPPTFQPRPSVGTPASAPPATTTAAPVAPTAEPPTAEPPTAEPPAATDAPTPPVATPTILINNNPDNTMPAPPSTP